MNLHKRMPERMSGSTRCLLTSFASLAPRTAALAAIALGLASLGGPVYAQQLLAVASPSADSIPDAPSAVAALQSQDQAQDHRTPTLSTPNGPINAQNGQPKQTKRILGVIPNFRAVSADQKLPPQSVSEKFKTTFQQSFDYSSFILPAVLAGVGQAENSVPPFHQGAAGYGRYYWHNLADQTSENFFVQAILPSALHQDSRYYTLGHGNVAKRGVYAFSRVFITRTDSDHETFNASEIVGAGAASGVSDLYYPESERTWTKTGQRWFLNVAIDGGTYLFQEFWPDINNAIFHQKD